MFVRDLALVHAEAERGARWVPRRVPRSCIKRPQCSPLQYNKKQRSRLANQSVGTSGNVSVCNCAEGAFRQQEVSLPQRTSRVSAVDEKFRRVENWASCYSYSFWSKKRTKYEYKVEDKHNGQALSDMFVLYFLLVFCALFKPEWKV